MIEEGKGNLLDADVEALVNTVNIVGVMGKGVALQFKIAYPQMFKEYQKACKLGQVQTGRMLVYQNNAISNPKFIINFPTKQHWKQDSKIEFIREGLVSLVDVINSNKIKSIALPPLGCGMGGLNWIEVLPLIHEAFRDIPDVKVIVFPPNVSNVPNKIIPKALCPELNWVRASVIRIMGQYPVLGYELTLLEANKLLYFLQESGVSLKLNFEKNTYGPYADNLRHLLISFEGHYITGLSQGSTKPQTPITLKPNALPEAERYINSDKAKFEENNKFISKVLELINGFESPYGLELLSTVHWTIKHENYEPTNVEGIIRHIQRWNSRKKLIMKPEHIKIALKRLEATGWV
ncbi:MAG: macro domain-containing protein [Methanoregula sp.]|nr:macro domain-containing protein [Methanoregula sp.]